MPDVQQLSDGVVSLRPMAREDAGVHLAGEDEPMVRFLSGGRSTMASVLAWIERNRVSFDNSGPVRCFGVRLVANAGELIGMVEANLAAPGFLPGVANVSYGLYPQARGYGYASRAVGLIMGYLKAETPADVVAIQVHPENLASKRLPVRLGFPFLGERVTEQGDRMLTYAMSIRGSRRLRLSNVCQS